MGEKTPRETETNGEKKPFCPFIYNKYKKKNTWITMQQEDLFTAKAEIKESDGK